MRKPGYKHFDMKPRFLTLIFLWSIAFADTYAQGTINVGNGITATRFPIYGPDYTLNWGSVTGNSALSQPTGSTVYGGQLLSGTRYAIEFWAGPASAVDFSGLTLITTMTFRTGANPNLLPNGLTVTTNLSVPGVLPGQQAKLAVRAWDASESLVYEGASTIGSGRLFLSTPLGGIAPDGNYLPANWVGESFSLISPPFPPQTPEPSTLALAGLGAAALLIFRRWK